MRNYSSRLPRPSCHPDSVFQGALWVMGMLRACSEVRSVRQILFSLEGMAREWGLEVGWGGVW